MCLYYNSFKDVIILISMDFHTLMESLDLGQK